MDKWDLFRINPLKFAQIYNFDTNFIIDIFVHSVKIGLFDFSWNLICPACGGIEHSVTNLNNIKGETFHCSTCDIDVSMEIDDQVEVAFTINSSIKDLQINPYVDLNNFINYYFSKNYIQAKELRDYREKSMIGFFIVQPDEDAIIITETQPNSMYRFISIEAHSNFYIYTDNKQAELPQIVEIDLLNNGFSPNKINIQSGKTKVYIHNRGKSIMSILAFKIEEGIYEIIKNNPNEKINFLTGKMLLNNQSFRELFRIQSLSKDLKLNVRSLTIMFTDLKGSTEMYEKAGDIRAYNLVQHHFKILSDSVRKHSGAIVKTMGDAIMATFSNPKDGLLSAIDMMNNIKNINEEWLKEGQQEVGLKIGLNEGSALVVNADERLDYFGQSVNIAARVQGLAAANEIWLTESIYNSNKIKDIIEENDYNYEKQQALLKGVGNSVIVYKCYNTD